MSTYAAEQAPAPHAAVPFQSGFVEFDRLEFGKYVVQRNGPIEAGAEHRVLGATRGFPQAILDDCDPSVLGVGGSLDDIPSSCAHGSVLRSVVVDDALIPVFARMRLRPEQGDGAAGRRYTVARYLVAPAAHSVSPLAYFDAMEREPVAGILRQEREDLTPIRAAVRLVPPFEVDAAFVERSLAYVMSGVPVAILGATAEEWFFASATAVWLRVPPSLRPLLSFGWGVTEELAGDLSMSVCAGMPRNAAAYDPASRTWTAPSFVEINGREARPFTDERTFPGRMFAHRAPSVTSIVGFGPSTDDLSARFRIRPAVELPRFPFMRNGAVVRILRWPGLRLLDDQRFVDFETWLESDRATPAEAQQFVGMFNYADTEHRALLTALSRAQARPQTTDAYFSALASAELEPVVEQELERGGRAEAARARLIRALAAGAAPAHVLELVTDAAVREQMAALPPAAVEQVIASMDGTSLDFGAVTAHAALIRLRSRPPFCSDWLRRNASRLALALMKWRPPGVLDVFRELATLAAEPAVAAIATYVRGEAPPNAAALHIDEDVRTAFSRQLSSDWEVAGAEIADRRDRILQWGAVVRPDPLRHPLLRFAYDEHTDGDVEAIATDIEQGHLPAALLTQASAFALAHWRVLGARIRQRRERWSALTALWPPVARLVLLDERAGSTEIVRQPIAQAFQELEIASDETELLLRRWVPRLDEADLETVDIARFIWCLAQQAEAGLGSTTCVNICRNIAAQNFQLHAEPTDEELDAVERLCAEAAENVSDERGRALFNEAARFWQLRLVLELFPRLPVEPTHGQLQVLARHRTWLQEHLARPDVIESRRNACRVALAQFHQYDYLGGSVRWQPEYSTSFLWAAFNGVPIAEQGALQGALLSDALQHYTRTTREVIAAASEYHRHLSAADRGQGIVRIIRQVLMPIFERTVGQPSGRVLLRTVHEENHPPQTRADRARTIVRNAWDRVTFQPRIRPERENVAQGLRHAAGRTIVVADWFHAFLVTIDARPEDVAAAFDGGGAA